MAKLALGDTAPQEGLHQNAPSVQAFVNLRIVTEPGHTIEHGTLVIRDGIIESVGEKIAVPADARIWDLKGMTIYPGLIDAHSSYGMPKAPASSATAPSKPDKVIGASYWNSRVLAEQDAELLFSPDQEAAQKLRTQGLTTALVSPPGGIFKGESALVNLGDGRANLEIVRPKVAQQIDLTVPLSQDPGSAEYPTTLMGLIALLRQTFIDADWYWRAQEAYRKNSQNKRPETNTALAALKEAVLGQMPVIIEVQSELDALRMQKIAKEFSLNLIIKGSGFEYRRLDAIKNSKRAFILPLNFPEAPAVQSPAEALQVSLSDLRAWDEAPQNPKRLHDAGVLFAFSSEGLKAPEKFLPAVRQAVERGLSPDAALAALTTAPAKLFGVADRLGTIAPGKIANFIVTTGDLFAPKTQIQAAWIDGQHYDVKASSEPAAPPFTPLAFETVYPAGEFGRAHIPDQPRALLVRNATLWTSGPKGILKNADLLVKRGKIAAIGKNLPAPNGALVIDARGKHVTPGIVDAHSHTAISGGSNEFGQAISAEVRIGDVINSDDIAIYYQLAGGVTTAHLLHGSINAIGGQNQVVKWRFGLLPEEMKFEGAPGTIKFALGENPRLAFLEKSTRYPKTRMGVEQIIRDEFKAALDYDKAWKRFKKSKTGPMPRRDLELEAVLEVLKGQRFVHCHAYRQDEIVMIMRVAEEFGFRIKALHHALDGYKVADLIKKHGASASVFADWWGYKIEAFDAIPYDGALLHDEGVLVSFNSDDDEQARRLNIEAAKAVKYGGLSNEEALKFVTINPAIQLGVQARVGSLELGKDADFVIWSGDPLSTYSTCEQTWIEGRRYFDKDEDREMFKVATKEHAALVQKVLSAGSLAAAPKKEGAQDD